MAIMAINGNNKMPIIMARMAVIMAMHGNANCHDGNNNGHHGNNKGIPNGPYWQMLKGP